ncbi:MAG TPA: hypothetical protein VHL59_11200 [Thermoanaerobaculia bacterium]|nr:hypothetical protein [Thermoanaerobaculia bacterium]
MNLPERDAAAFRLSESELALLRQWLGRHVAQVVCDLTTVRKRSNFSARTTN